MLKRWFTILLVLSLAITSYSNITLAKEVGALPTPVLQVSFDDETVRDHSPSNLQAEIVGNVSYVDGVNGGKAIYFNNPSDANKAAEQYVNFGQPDALKFGKDSFSIVFWYKTDKNSKPESSIVSNKNWATGNNQGFNIGNMNQGVNFNFNASGKPERAETDRFSQAKDGEWHHIAAIVDRQSQKMSLYIDGKLAQGGAGFQSNQSTVNISKHTGSIDVGDFVLGADGVDHKYGLNEAAVDQLAVYKAALTPEQMKEIINNESGNIYIHQEINDLRKKVDSLIIGNRFTQTDIDAFIQQLNEFEQVVGNLSFDEANDRLLTIRNHYQQLMKGNNNESMSFHLVSDMHIGSGAAGQNFAKALDDMKMINPNAAALVSAGDNTQDGKPAEKKELYDLINEKQPFKGNHALLALGNHDVRGPSGATIIDPVTGQTIKNVWQSVPNENNTYWNTAYKLYMEHNAKFMPEGTTTPYFDRWIDGYHFIIVNPENGAKDTAWMSEAQLEWLDEKLAENADPTKPKFIIAHQALNDTHRQSNVNNGFGPQDAAMKEILAKHPQAILISGHAHNGLGVVEAMHRSYGVLVDLPSFSQVWNGDKSNGTGYEVYVYDNEIYFSARNFVTQQWLPEHDISISLPGLPITYQEANQLTEENVNDPAVWETLQNVKKEANNLLNMEYDWDELVNNTPGPKKYGAQTQLEIKSVQKLLQEAIDSALSSTNITATDIKLLIESFVENGELTDERISRTLLMHIAAVEQYEKNQSATKVVKHMESFKALLNSQQQQLPENMYQILINHSETLIKKWQ